jgi:hypothetical protein
MTNQEFENIIAANPSLTTHGFGIDGNPGETFETERAKLHDCYDEALACEEFLLACKRTKQPQKQLGSTYRFKHVVERFVDRRKRESIYIREGALILAAIHLGFQMKPKAGATSVYLNISKRTKIDGIWVQSF